LEFLEHCTALETLNLCGTGISGEGLGHLRFSKDLKELYLGNSVATGAGLRYLPPLPALTTLDIYGVKLTDADLEVLKQVPKMTSLDPRNCEIHGPGLANLRHVPLLESLVLNDVSGAQLRSLPLMPNLRSLSIRKLQCTDDELEFLKQLPKIPGLDLSGCDIH